MHVASMAIRPQLEISAHAPVPTRHGVFQMYVFRWEGTPDARDAALGLSPDHVALVMGEVRGSRGVVVRVHSECLTSEAFGSLKCDCKEQLESAQAEIARRGQGALLYLRQEGRGIGLSNKIRAYQLQSHGHDTVDANRMLGLPDDARDYAPAAAMLEHLGVGSIRLLTNNPLKVQSLRAHGVIVDSRLASHVRPTAFSAGYLEAKRIRMGHALPNGEDDAPMSRPGVELPADAE